MWLNPQSKKELNKNTNPGETSRRMWTVGPCCVEDGHHLASYLNGMLANLRFSELNCKVISATLVGFTQ